MAGDLNTPEALADVLRSAAAWTKLAAERLEAGQLEDALNMAKLGAFGVEGMPERIAALADHKSSFPKASGRSHTP